MLKNVNKIYYPFYRYLIPFYIGIVLYVILLIVAYAQYKKAIIFLQLHRKKVHWCPLLWRL